MSLKSGLLTLIFLGLASAAQAEVPADKPASATLKSLEAGDVACYATLTLQNGSEQQEMAAFEICEQNDLVGKKVKLDYTSQNVQADSCQGNPDCTESKTVMLISSMTAE